MEKRFFLLHIDLVKGNHDILDDSWYDEANISVSSWKLAEPPFVFLHDLKAEKKLEGDERSLYRFTGHVHPGITVRGSGRQSLHFPCFYFAKEFCVLPAFSRFTGTYRVVPAKDEAAFAIVDDNIMRFP